MLTSLAVTNFKSWTTTGLLTLKPVTAFLGSNSSGKTSLLQAILLLRQTTESRDRGRVFDLGGPASLIDLGTIGDVVNDHDLESEIGIDLSWRAAELFKMTDVSNPKNRLPESDLLRIASRVKVTDGTPTVQSIEYGMGDASFTMTRRAGKKSEYDLASKDYTFIRVAGRPWPLPSPGKFYSFPDQVRAYYQNAAVLSDLELAFESACSRIFYLGPLRHIPERQYISSGGRPDDVGPSGESTVEALVASRSDRHTNSRGFSKRNDRRVKLPRISLEVHIAQWLRELGLIHSFVVRSLDSRETLFRVLVRKSADSPEVTITDVGFGVSQILPILVLLAYVPEGSTVILEQPEIHLHPAVQSKLADIIAEAAIVRGIQVILETHSEHLLARFQRRIAEQRFGANIPFGREDFAAYFCSYTGVGSHVEQLRLDEGGGITNWPRDFFGDSLGESLARTRAALRTRRARD